METTYSNNDEQHLVDTTKEQGNITLGYEENMATNTKRPDLLNRETVIYPL